MWIGRESERGGREMTEENRVYRRNVGEGRERGKRREGVGKREWGWRGGRGGRYGEREEVERDIGREMGREGERERYVEREREKERGGDLERGRERGGSGERGERVYFGMSYLMHKKQHV